jgi:hypothetical protein
VELEYTLVTEDYVAFNAHVARTSGPMRAQVVRLRVAGSVVVAVALVLVVGAFERDWIGGAVTGAIGAVVAWFVVPPLNRWLVDRTIRRFAAGDGLGPVGPVRLTIDEAGLREEMAGTTSTATWDRVERVDETDEHAFVFVGPVAAVVLPKRDARVLRAVAEIRSRASVVGA